MDEAFLVREGWQGNFGKGYEREGEIQRQEEGVELIVSGFEAQDLHREVQTELEVTDTAKTFHPPAQQWWDMTMSSRNRT